MPEKKTKSFILRVDADTMNAIEAWAADEFRSTNGQLQWKAKIGRASCRERV